jgi:hypothetical protein
MHVGAAPSVDRIGGVAVRLKVVGEVLAQQLGQTIGGPADMPLVIDALAGNHHRPQVTLGTSSGGRRSLVFDRRLVDLDVRAAVQLGEQSGTEEGQPAHTASDPFHHLLARDADLVSALENILQAVGGQMITETADQNVYQQSRRGEPAFDDLGRGRRDDGRQMPLVAVHIFGPPRFTPEKLAGSVVQPPADFLADLFLGERPEAIEALAHIADAGGHEDFQLRGEAQSEPVASHA